MTDKQIRSFTTKDLFDGCFFQVGRLPADLRWDDATFEEVWRLRPAEKYARGQITRASPVPPLLEPLLAWARAAIDGRLNRLLLEWYARTVLYLDVYHDSTAPTEKGAPIVTTSFGEPRRFRLCRHPAFRMCRNLRATPSRVFVWPYATNQIWKRFVPKSDHDIGRCISVTLVARTTGVVPASAPVAE